MIIQYETHACLSFELGKDKLVCDPWIIQQPVYNYTTWKFPPPKNNPHEIASKATILFITHTHEDHFHIPSLLLFRKDIPVITSNYDGYDTPRSRTMERTLKLIGFNNITKLHNWESINIGDAKLTLVPSAKTRAHDWENSGFIIEHDGIVALNMNDNVSDDELCLEIRKRFPKIDIAFIQSMGVTMWPGRYRMDKNKMHDEKLKKTISFAEQKRMVDIVRPMHVVPFAGDFCWLDERFMHQNWANRGTPELFISFMKNNAENKGCNVLLMEPGDTWDRLSGHKKNSPRINWNYYLEDIKELAKTKSKQIDIISNYLDSFSDENLVEKLTYRLNYIKNNIEKNNEPYNCSIRYIVESEDSNFTFYLWVDHTGFNYSFIEPPIDFFQTFYVPKRIMAAILGGGLTWNIIQWVVDMEQHFKPSKLGAFLFWLEYHIDLNSKNPEVYLDEMLISPNYSNPKYVPINFA